MAFSPSYIFCRGLMMIWNSARSIKRKWLTLIGQNRHALPPAWDQIPSDLQARFALEQRIPVEHLYLDDAYPETKPIHFSRFKVDYFMKRIQAREFVYYGKTLNFMHEAFTRFPLSDKEVAIMGSNTPVCEAMTLLYGGRPTTIEYNKLVTNDPRLTLVTVKEFQENPRQFDLAISISSFEHDGLGRYGDPLNPDGDLATMASMQKVVKPGGLLYLAVPVGRDCLVWNAGRCYGPIRFPMLVAGWTVLEVIGKLDFERDWSDNHQPVVVLRNEGI